MSLPLRPIALPPAFWIIAGAALVSGTVANALSLNPKAHGRLTTIGSHWYIRPERQTYEAELSQTDKLDAGADARCEND